MEITTSLIKELRERTWIWMMDCKKALTSTNWDIELAIDELRKKWLAKAVAKADREASEWWIKISLNNWKAYVVSVLCETDFLANTARYQDMLSAVIEEIVSWKNKEQAQEMINLNFSLEMWENLQIKDYLVIEGNTFGYYTHSNNKLAALVIWNEKWEEDKLKQVAMHITATNPLYLSPNEISQEVVDKEKNIQLEIMKNDPKMIWKPDEVLLKIIEWKMWKFKSEISLLEQDFVVNPDVKVKTFIWEDVITKFYRFSI